MLQRHLWKLVFHVVVLGMAFFLYFFDIARLDFTSMLQEGFGGIFLWVVWGTFVVGMLLRIFPNRKIAVGARKHFQCTYKGAEFDAADTADTARMMKLLNRGALVSALAWLACSVAFFFALFLIGKLASAAILVLTLIYSVIDLVFILFFCPFRVLFLKNHCCTVCRIYNWDYFMMCAPLIFFPSFFSISLFLLSLIVLLRWEMALRKNPHFFAKETNENLRCDSCDDKLCKIRLRIFRA